MKRERTTEWKLCCGGVQAYICQESPNLLMYHFGLPEYDRNKPIISDRKREEVKPILDKLNSNEISFEEAKKLLDRIW